MASIMAYLLIAIISHSVHANTGDADECVNEYGIYYDSIGAIMYPHHSTYKDYKKGHDITYHKMNSIKPENVVTHVCDKVYSIQKSKLNDFRQPLKTILKRDLHFDVLPTDLSNKIDMQTDLASFLNKGQEYYIRVDLSEHYGATSHLGYGVFAFLPDPNNDDQVIFGATAMREEWKEKDNVKLLKEKWDKKDVEKYVIHELYQRIHPKISESQQFRITNGDDPYEVQPFEELIEFTSISCRDRQTHVIFISDRSGSMSASMPGAANSKEFIKQNNRLGSLFSAIDDFIQVRSTRKCNDVITSILFESSVAKVDERVQISETFVKDFLVQQSAWGGTNFGKAFNKANELIKYDEQTMVIFLTDGEAGDGGSSNIVKTWFANMSEKLKLFCVVIGNSNSEVVNNICKNGNGEVRNALNGQDLVDGYKEFAAYKVYRNQ